MTDPDVDGPHPAAPGRTTGAVFWHVVGRLAVGALGLMFIALLFGAGLVAYQDLAGAALRRTPDGPGRHLLGADLPRVPVGKNDREVEPGRHRSSGADGAGELACNTRKCPPRRVLAGGHAGFSPHDRLRHVGGRVTHRTGTGLVGLQGRQS